ncbi:methyltransferase domain-containing protein [Pseudoalteromonas denitrificans]|uniref:TPR repeat-containing protein n=1 Tax=Pseudoalteromonas denitrificans DSM 6059 TaxID=1123010 RepID=A0A1I1HPI2_9GAMM|nr:methyltransferase domain-containing protein [Pseudoalteromonas denitrificans]SFC25482.1 TPR repeat-containing protein [Pseudoalteromonas denitrificans DSM 6059]
MTQDYLKACKQLIGQGKYHEAITGLEFILHLNPNLSAAYSNLAICYSNLKNWNKAITSILNALGHGNNQYQDLEELLNILEKSELKSYVPLLEKPLKLAMELVKLEFRVIPLLWRQLISKHPKALSLASNSFTHAIDLLLQDEVFCKLIERSLITDYFTENLILISRQEILSRAVEGDDIHAYLPFLSSLACQTLLNDGLYSNTKQDRLYLNKILDNQNTTLEHFLLLICHSSFEESLMLWKKNQDLFKNDQFKSLTSDLQFYTDVSLSKNKGIINQKTSKLVQSFYMENPYPKWKSVKVSNQVKTNETDILFAGCGTGQQLIDFAITHKMSHITAIDLSPTSIAYAELMTKKYDISNVNFILLDILDIDTLGLRFDYIVCTGVLHHMACPSDGLAALNKVLTDNGRMFLGFYSRAARKSLKNIKKNIMTFLKTDEEGITRSGIKQWRSQLTTENKANAWYQVSDFFYLNGLYDLLIHPQQIEYSIPEIKALLNKCNLSFVSMSPTIKNREEFKLILAQNPTNKDKQTLDYWHKIELRYPEAFIYMYQFHVVKSPSSVLNNKRP